MRWSFVLLVVLLAGCTLPEGSDDGGPPSGVPTVSGTAPTAGPTPTGTPTALPSDLVPFDAERAYNLVLDQVLYPSGEVRTRVPGTEGNEEVAAFIAGSLREMGWDVRYHRFNATYGCKTTPMHNVIAERAGTSGKIVMLGAHYDTRPIADKDPSPANRSLPIPGANDAASGVAVLLELARVMPPTDDTVRLAFWDGEDGGGYLGARCTDWILGSEAYNASLSDLDRASIRAYVLVDMIGDAQATIPWEGNSDVALRTEVYDVAQRLGYDEIFVQKPGWSITDDHVPFARAGVPTLDLIHTSIPPAQPVFPAWHHTMQDDIFNVSAATLGAVGNVLQVWLDEL